jgi:hypothetical protein
VFDEERPQYSTEAAEITQHRNQKAERAKEEGKPTGDIRINES